MFKSSFVSLFLLLVSSLSAQSFKPLKDTLAFKLAVEKMSRETKTIKSDFQQVKNLKVLAEKVTSRGSFVFSKQNNLRWEYNSPYHYVIVINNQKILIKDENNKVKKYDMGSNRVFKEINDIMVSCVNGEVLRSGKFRVRYFENDKGYLLELQPVQKTMQQSLKKINMYFDRAVTSVQKLEMFEPGDDVTTLEFTNKKINEAVPSDTFILK